MRRTLYVGQKVSIVAGDTGNPITGWLPISSANCEVNQPLEPVTSFGRLGSLKLAQTNLTTCKSSIKTYLTSGTLDITSGKCQSLTAGLISAITGDATQGRITVIDVSPNGFRMSGIVTSFGVDMAVGSLGTADFTFQGIGHPYFYPLTGNATTPQSEMPTTIEPITMIHVSGQTTNGCANSFKFSMDMPTDTLSCFGDLVNEVQWTGIKSIMATKPPYKATITVEGFGVDISASGATTSLPTGGEKYSFGGLHITLPNGIATSKSFNNAVGTAGASYNYTAEDVSATFETS